MAQHRAWTASLVLWIVLAAVVMAEGMGAEGNDLGRTDFPNSGSPEAQEHFLEGLLALHSFEYADAREAFQQAREVEPDFAMAAWGEAMTYNHPLWLEEDRESATAALERLAPTREERAGKAPTAREKAYLEAVEILFGEGDKLTRDLAYAEATERLMKAYPEDLDAASFHALALLGTCHDGRDTATYMKAAAIVEQVFAKNPLHPGAAHYLIHSYDDPIHAPLGLRPAKVYAEIAPAAEHALHMPSHVFLALGMWEETASSNVDSYEAGEARRSRKNLGVEARGYHAMLWLFYANLQLGRVDEARAQLDLIASDNEVTDSRRTRRHFAQMRSIWIAETGRGDDLPAGPDLDGLSPDSVASDLFATGYAAVLRGEIDEAERIRKELVEKYHAAAHVEDQATVSCEGYSRFGPVKLVAPRIMELELEALILEARGERDRALELLAEAAAAEETRSFGFGPPVPAKPAHELYGEMLLAAGRVDEARRQFEISLERAPKRAKSLAGLAAAARQAGDETTARKTAGVLTSIRRNADPAP